MTTKKPTAARPRVAYYCMEYGLSPSLHTYSGGLGILAGDFLKAAHDGNYPMVALGILWHQGYGEQVLGDDGSVTSVYRPYENPFLTDTKATVSVTIRGRRVICKIWRCDSFGNVPLYLLDTRLPQNGDMAGLCDQLYGGDRQLRVAQEIVLGVGGYRALRKLKIAIDVHHFNEGHPVFAGLEMLRESMARGRTFAAAVAATRPRIVFTTHTPIPAGNEEHDLAELTTIGALDGLTRKQAVSLGGAPFNMTAAALRLAHRANAVAELHEQVSQRMWKGLKGAAPIIPITNAIHVPTWVDPRMLKATTPAALWARHQQNKKDLLRFIRERTGARLDADKLLIAFSRRAATYKRWDLLFGDARAAKALLRSGRVQLVFSGKAHPNDQGGREMIERVLAVAREYPNQVAFLPNYDMTIGRALTRGADVWLNCPRRPNEASGTSGMKAAMNGVLNLSILDGWWPEACRHGINGWQYGDGKEFASATKQDNHDRDCLYEVLRDEVIPAYYRRRPVWLHMMKASIATTRDVFSADRMMAQYYQDLYTK